MSAITLEGKLYMLEQERAFKAEDAVRFLKHLMHQIPLTSCWWSLGWFADSSRRGAHRFPCQRGSFSAATRKVARLRSRSQPRRRDLQAPQVRGAKEPLLCESLSELKVELRKAKERLRHKRGHPWLHKAARVRGLDACDEIHSTCLTDHEGDHSIRTTLPLCSPHARSPRQRLASLTNSWNVLEAERCPRNASRILWRSSAGIWSGATSGSGRISIISGLEAASCAASTSSMRLRASGSSSNPVSKLSRGNHTLSFWALGCEVSNGTSRASRARSSPCPKNLKRFGGLLSAEVNSACRTASARCQRSMFVGEV